MPVPVAVTAPPGLASFHSVSAESAASAGLIPTAPSSAVVSSSFLICLTLSFMADGVGSLIPLALVPARAIRQTRWTKITSDWSRGV